MSSAPSSTTSSENSPALEAAKRTVKYWDRKGRLELWAGTLGMRGLEHEQESHRKNREAEESHARKHIWDWDESKDTHDEDDMHGTTYLGDITQTPVVYPPQSSNAAWPIVAGLALASLFPAAGLAAFAGYWLSKDAVPVVDPIPPATDRDSTYRIEKWTPPQ